MKIIPEPYGAFEIGEDLKAVYADPAQTPRDPATKKAAQRTAIEWLSKMATGARPGFEVKSAEPELRAALAIPYLTDAAIDGVAALGSALAQQDLLRAGPDWRNGRPNDRNAHQGRGHDHSAYPGEWQAHSQDADRSPGRAIPDRSRRPTPRQTPHARGNARLQAGRIREGPPELQPTACESTRQKEPAKEPKEPGKGPDQKQ